MTGSNFTSNFTSDLASHGWVSEPNGRGTWNILSTCVLTIVLCCWTSMCPNIPAPQNGTFTQLRDQLHLALMGVLGPEFLLMVTLGEWSSARASVKVRCSIGTTFIIFHSCFQQEFRRLGHDDWTMMHGFYADMGGFVLHGPGIKSPFPVDSRQLLFLIRKGYIRYPRLAEEEICDRNKSDGFARCLAVLQAVFMVVNCAVRVNQGLAVTTLELTTLSFILIFFVTSFCWYHKPSGITTRVPVSLEVHIDRVLIEVCQRLELLFSHFTDDPGYRMAIRRKRDGVARHWTSSRITSTSVNVSGATTIRSWNGCICPYSLDQ